MEPTQQTQSLFDRLSDLADGQAVRVLGQSAVIVDEARRQNRIMQVAMPVDLGVSALAFAVGTDPSTVAGKVAVGVGATAASAHYLGVARRARDLGRLERQWAAEGEAQVALFVGAARVELLRLLPNSRTRVAAGLLRCSMHAAQCDIEEIRDVVVTATNREIASLPERIQERCLKEAVKLSRKVEGLSDPADRSRARSALVNSFSRAESGQLGELAIDAAIDFCTWAQEEWGRQSDMFVFVCNEDDEVVDVDTIENWEEEVERDVVHDAINDATVHFGAGLAMISTHDGADVADAWARKLVRDDRVGTGIVLNAYELMLRMTDDARLEEFQAALAERDPERGAALQFLGVERDGGERGGLER